MIKISLKSRSICPNYICNKSKSAYSIDWESEDALDHMSSLRSIRKSMTMKMVLRYYGISNALIGLPALDFFRKVTPVGFTTKRYYRRSNVGYTDLDWYLPEVISIGMVKVSEEFLSIKDRKRQLYTSRR